LSGWIPDRRPVFARQFKRLDPAVQTRVTDAVLEILASDNPARLGKYKQGQRVFAYDLGRKYRIIYNINWSANTIEFIRVCDHKSVTG